MRKPLPTKPSMDWRITLRPGMTPVNCSRVKVFLSVSAFNGYVSALRAHGVVVSFTTPFVATCAEAA